MIFFVEEILDMPTESEVQMNLPCTVCKVQMDLANNACVGQDELCKDESHDESNHGLFCVTKESLNHKY